MQFTPTPIPAFLHHPELEPLRATDEAAAFDLRARIDRPVRIMPGNSMRIPTGLHVELPLHHVGLICPRSGFADKYKVTVGNAPGIIDADFRGEIGVILINHGSLPFTVEPMERIAQLLITYRPPVVFHFVEALTELAESLRGQDGFGHTGAA